MSVTRSFVLHFHRSLLKKKSKNTNKTPANVGAAPIQWSCSFSAPHPQPGEGLLGLDGWIGMGLSEQGMPAVLGAGLAWSALSWLLHTSSLGGTRQQPAWFITSISQQDGQLHWFCLQVCFLKPSQWGCLVPVAIVPTIKLQPQRCRLDSLKLLGLLTNFSRAQVFKRFHTAPNPGIPEAATAVAPA